MYSSYQDVWWDGIRIEGSEVCTLSEKNLFSIGTLEALGHGVSIKDDALKMTKGSMVVLKGVWRNNIYYLMGSTVTGRVTTSISSGDICTQVWHMRLGHTGEKSLQALAKKRSLKVHLLATWNWVDTTFWTRRRGKILHLYSPLGKSSWLCSR